MLPSDRRTRLAILETYLALYRSIEQYFEDLYAVTGDSDLRAHSRCALEHLHRSFDELISDDR